MKRYIHQSDFLDGEFQIAEAEIESKDKTTAELHTILQCKLTEETNRDKAQKLEISELKKEVMTLEYWKQGEDISFAVSHRKMELDIVQLKSDFNSLEHDYEKCQGALKLKEKEMSELKDKFIVDFPRLLNERESHLSTISALKEEISELNREIRGGK